MTSWNNARKKERCPICQTPFYPAIGLWPTAVVAGREQFICEDCDERLQAEPRIEPLREEGEDPPEVADYDELTDDAESEDSEPEEQIPGGVTRVIPPTPNKRYRLPRRDG